MKYLLLCICMLSCATCWRVQQFKTVTVAIQPFEGADRASLKAIESSIRQVYGFRVIMLPETKLPKEAFVNIKMPRYRADKLLSYLLKIRPDSVNYIIGVTTSDISTTKRDGLGKIKEPQWKYDDWGIMGLGYRPGRSCVISTFRLKWERADKLTYLERVKKVAVHEIGHNLSLPHCYLETCVMTSAKESIKTIDKVRLALCENCSKKIDN